MLAKLLRPFTHYCVGSLPFQDPLESIQFIVERPWIVPFWPELPQGSDQGLMIERADRAFDPEWKGYKDEEAPALFALGRYVEERGRKFSLLKCQAVGPLTHMRYSHETLGDSPAALILTRDACMRQLAWQVKCARTMADNILFVLDEPGFSIWDSLAEDDRRFVLETYSYLAVRAQELNVSLGIHFCGEPDRNLFELPFDLFSFNATTLKAGNEIDDLRAGWSTVIHRGGILVPGIFPSLVAGSVEDAFKSAKEEQQTVSKKIAELDRSGELPILCSAVCGHAQSSLDWIERLYRIS